MTLGEVGRKQCFKPLSFLHPDEVSKSVSALSLLYFTRKLPNAMLKDMFVDEFKPV
jgi:hypothetical protein